MPISGLAEIGCAPPCKRSKAHSLRFAMSLGMCFAMCHMVSYGVYNTHFGGVAAMAQVMASQPRYC